MYCSVEVSGDRISNYIASDSYERACENALECAKNTVLEELNTRISVGERNFITNLTIAVLKQKSIYTPDSWVHMTLYKKNPYDNIELGYCGNTGTIIITNETNFSDKVLGKWMIANSDLFHI